MLLPRGCPDDDAAMAEAATEQTAKPNGGETGKGKESVLDICLFYHCVYEPIGSILVPPCGFCCIAMQGSEDGKYWDMSMAKRGGDVAARAEAIRQERKECCKDLAKILLTVAGLGIITSCIKCIKDLKKLTSEGKKEAANMATRWIMFAPYDCLAGADPEVISVPGLIEKKVAPDVGGAPPAADADDSLVCWLAGVPPEADAMER